MTENEPRRGRTFWDFLAELSAWRIGGGIIVLAFCWGLARGLLW